MLIIIKSNHLFFILTHCLSCTCKLDHTGKVIGLFEKEHEHRYNWSVKERKIKDKTLAVSLDFSPILCYQTLEYGSYYFPPKKFPIYQLHKWCLIMSSEEWDWCCAGFTLDTSSKPMPRREDLLIPMEVLWANMGYCVQLLPSNQSEVLLQLAKDWILSCKIDSSSRNKGTVSWNLSLSHC